MSESSLRDRRKISESAIIEHSPIVKHGSTIASRFVIWRMGPDIYAVHQEFYPEFPKLHSSYRGGGCYFKSTQLAYAMALFAKKANDHAELVDAIEGAVL